VAGEEFKAMPPVQHGVRITMSTATVESLAGSGNFLYGLPVVQCSDTAGEPLVWYRSSAYSPNTVLRWAALYQAYTSTSTGALSPGTQVDAGFSIPMATGQLLAVNAPGGIGTVREAGCPAALSIVNRTTMQLTCGVSMARPDGSFGGVCALPLYGKGLQIVQPLARVLFLFSPRDAPVWTVADVATGPGVLVSLEAGATRELAFDRNAGWSWGGAPWAEGVDAESQLKPLLVQHSQPLIRYARQDARVAWP
jgi:hypothetical protein